MTSLLLDAASVNPECVDLRPKNYASFVMAMKYLLWLYMHTRVCICMFSFRRTCFSLAAIHCLSSPRSSPRCKLRLQFERLLVIFSYLLLHNHHDICFESFISRDIQLQIFQAYFLSISLLFVK